MRYRMAVTTANSFSWRIAFKAQRSRNDAWDAPISWAATFVLSDSPTEAMALWRTLLPNAARWRPALDEQRWQVIQFS
jgi:hypothetical protein